MRILAHGLLLRLRCGDRGHDKLPAFSYKRRGLQPFVRCHRSQGQPRVRSHQRTSEPLKGLPKRSSIAQRHGPSPRNPSTYSRFQAELLAKAKAAGKILADYETPERYRNNFPEVLAARFKAYREAGRLPACPSATTSPQNI